MKSEIRGAVMAAALGVVFGASGFATQMARPSFSTVKVRKPYPTMVTSSPEEIAAWNAAVATRQVMRRKNRPARVRRTA